MVTASSRLSGGLQPGRLRVERNPTQDNQALTNYLFHFYFNLSQSDYFPGRDVSPVSAQALIFLPKLRRNGIQDFSEWEIKFYLSEEIILLDHIWSEQVIEPLLLRLQD